MRAIYFFNDLLGAWKYLILEEWQSRTTAGRVLLPGWIVMSALQWVAVAVLVLPVLIVAIGQRIFGAGGET